MIITRYLVIVDYTYGDSGYLKRPENAVYINDAPEAGNDWETTKEKDQAVKFTSHFTAEEWVLALHRNQPHMDAKRVMLARVAPTIVEDPNDLPLAQQKKITQWLEDGHSLQWIKRQLKQNGITVKARKIEKSKVTRYRFEYRGKEYWFPAQQ